MSGVLERERGKKRKKQNGVEKSSIESCDIVEVIGGIDLVGAIFFRKTRFLFILLALPSVRHISSSP